MVHAQTCVDNSDNDGDGRADWDGVPEKNLPPDPSCINEKSVEKPDGNCSDGIDNNGNGKADQADASCKNGGSIEGSLIPCEDKCDLASVFALLNNLIDFLIKVILFPVAIIMFVYAGYTYIVHSDSAGKRVQAKKMIKHLILGMVLILTAWLIVKTALVLIGYDQSLFFFD